MDDVDGLFASMAGGREGKGGENFSRFKIFSSVFVSIL